MARGLIVKLVPLAMLMVRWAGKSWLTSMPVVPTSMAPSSVTAPKTLILASRSGWEGSKVVVSTRTEVVAASVESCRASVGVVVGDPSRIFGLVIATLSARTRPPPMTSVSVATGDPAGDQFCGSLKLPVPPNQVCTVGAGGAKTNSEISVGHTIPSEPLSAGHSSEGQKYAGSTRSTVVAL